MGYGLDGRGSSPSRNNGLFLLHSIQASSGAHKASCPMVTGGSYPGVKGPGYDVNHSTLSSGEVKYCGIVPPRHHGA
jgi:hypothetical protein